MSMTIIVTLKFQGWDTVQEVREEIPQRHLMLSVLGSRMALFQRRCQSALLTKRESAMIESSVPILRSNSMMELVIRHQQLASSVYFDLALLKVVVEEDIIWKGELKRRGIFGGGIS
jgi:hypothetical protein